MLETFLFLFLTLKINFAGIFIIIFVICTPKYVGIVSSKLIRGKCFSEVYPFVFYHICFKDRYDYVEFRCHNMNKCKKTSAFPILKQYYTKFSFIFIICSNEKSFNVHFEEYTSVYLYFVDY